jgi:hypothetical protein
LRRRDNFIVLVVLVVLAGGGAVRVGIAIFDIMRLSVHNAGLG